MSLAPLALAFALSVRPVPALTGPVVDQARMLSDDGVARLAALARAAHDAEGGKGVQLQYLLVPTLDGEPIEDLSIRVAEAWQIGTKGRDNGLLFVVAQSEHRFRLEVGGGLEGELTDIQSKGILDDTLTPAFRRGDYAGGLYRAGVQALILVHGLPANIHAPQGYGRSAGVPMPVLLVGLLFFLHHGGWILLLIVYLYLRLVVFRRSAWFGWGSTSYGGGWGSSSSSGSSWSGGGGGFSGGGASGGW